MSQRLNYLRLATKAFQASAAFVAVAAWCVTVQAQSIRTYDVNFTTNNIVADGINSPGEWDGAASGGGGWNEIRQAFGDADADANEFVMLWDNDNLYLKWENTFDDWLTEDTGNTNPNVDFGVETLNIYIDPNLDGEANDVPDNEVDGYQIAPNIVTNSAGGATPIISTSADRGGVGFFTEAHVDGLFGNNGNWGGAGADAVQGLGIQDAVIASKNENAGDPNPGGFMEMVIPWTDFNADAMIDDGAGGMKETGLNHPFAPSDGDIWFFNIAAINNATPANFLPAWNWTSSDFFSSHGNGGEPMGHGEISFVGGGNPVDADGDGDVDGTDFLILQRDNPALIPDWEAAYPGAAPAIGAVPEPTSIALLATSIALAVGRRRR